MIRESNRWWGKGWTWRVLGFLILASGLDLSRGGAEMVPFVLPWDDASGGITDFSALNQPIRPGSRVSTNGQGQFVANGQRLRFLGVNFAGDSTFMPTNKADAVAARLARFGLNSVRFHHLDAPWATDGGLIQYTPTRSRALNPTQLERVHFLVSRLKAHGIYANLNLLVGREFRSDDGLGPEVVQIADWKDRHILGFFNDTALSLQQEFATQFLTPTNPFTGLSLAHDPAVAFVEILNENGLIQKWYDGGLDRLPEPYAGQLRSEWNRWLANRYSGDVELRRAWKTVEVPLGENQVLNGTFDSTLRGWNVEQHDVAKATFAQTNEFNGRGALRVDVTEPGTAGWHVQVNQGPLKTKVSNPYTVSMWVRADPPRSLEVAVSRAYGDYAPVGLLQSVEAGREWREVVLSFLAAETDDRLRLNFGGLGLMKGQVWLADVRLQPGGKLGGIPDTLSLEGKSVPLVRRKGEGFTGTLESRRDWLAFLRELEVRYYQRMVSFLREKVGYPGLIFGTILDNSPASVQAQLDVVDSHAYWQHPEFPGQSWDPENWRVGNRSLVNAAPGENTLAKLARQRIHGRPFTVTEYQHAAPNSYSAEGVLLLAAYGAFQDWDGIWMFDYGPGQDSVSMGRIRGFFDIAQNPAQMANLLLAANLFRRGDVARGPTEVSTYLTPEKELDLLLERAGSWFLFSGGQLGLGSRLPLVRRVSTRLEAAVPPQLPQDPGGNVFVAEGGALTWDVSEPDQGLVMINTPRTSAFVGFPGPGPVDWGLVVAEFGRTHLGWVTFGLTVREGNSLLEGARALLVVTGRTENTGQTWKNPARTTLGKEWGEAPVRTEVVPFQLTLRVPASRVKVWTLDERGQRRKALPVKAVAGGAQIQVSGSEGSLWYELETQAP
ncbi:MAG: carbohydrate binding domain-containing protein [Verrucomicrobia bacterium]|nr:carbohydrate binding domain-containing protein [Verrucomicrobiota bacterium]